MKSLIPLLLLCLLLGNGYSQKTAEEWQAIIDTTWGEGLPTADKLEIFDLIWNTIDDDYAGFHNLDVNWDSLKNVFRPEIENGVSRGRFYGIISHLYLALQEAHTKFLDLGIYHSDLKHGIPLLVYQSGYDYNDHGHFGAGLSPLPDSSLLVYKVIENHPLGLVPGDIVLGYDGIPWKVLYKQLLAACLPITSLTEPFASLIGLYTFGGSSDRSAAHLWLTSAGLNWHLFDIIDIIKYGSNDTLHLHTNPLDELDTQLICTEQLPVAGVPIPDLSQVSNDMITWGVIDGTQIGYIYACHWAEFLDAAEGFTNAVNALLDDYQTEGLIIDSRINAGGQPWAANDGFSRLFNFNAEILDFAERSDLNDHYALEETNGRCGDRLRFNADPLLYDKPIAVLTGPLSWSAGDVNAMRLKYHPMTRFFGKPTNTAYICMGYDWNFFPSYPDWFGAYAPMNAYLLDNPGHYLTHVGFDVDEEVWLSQEDVAKGEDTVVKRAIEWIQNLAYAHDVTVDKLSVVPGADSIKVTTMVQNPNEHPLSVSATIRNQDSTMTEQLSLFDDGYHGDGAADDNLWGNFYLPAPDKEELYKISVRTDDLTEGTSRILPNVAWFTTIGPLKIDSYSILSADTIPNHGDILSYRFTLKNEGQLTPATVVTSKLLSADTCVSVRQPLVKSYDTILPGETAIASGSYYVQFNDVTAGCSDPMIAQLILEISNEGYVFWYDTLDIVVDIEDVQQPIPKAFALSQNYPNPFNPTTKFNYELPKISDVELSIYNLLGQKVTTLVDKRQQPGYHQVEWDASGFASGVYYYRLVTSAGFIQSRKLVLLR